MVTKVVTCNKLFVQITHDKFFRGQCRCAGNYFYVILLKKTYCSVAHTAGNNMGSTHFMKPFREYEAISGVLRVHGVGE